MNKSIMPHVNKWATLGRALLFCLGCGITLAITSGLTRLLGTPWSTLASLLIAILFTIALTFLFTRWQRIGLNDIGIMPGKYSLSRMLFGFIIGLIMAGLQPLLLLLFSGHIRLVLSTQLVSSQIITSFFLYVLVAVREEIAFRAYPLRVLSNDFGPLAALAIIFVVFSLEHVMGGMSWGQAFMGAGVGSILFGIAALSTKGLAMPIGLHIAWNFGQWAFGFKDSTGIWHAVVDKAYETQLEVMGFIIYLVIMILVTSGFYFYWRKKAISLP